MVVSSGRLGKSTINGGSDYHQRTNLLNSMCVVGENSIDPAKQLKYVSTFELLILIRVISINDGNRTDQHNQAHVIPRLPN